MTQPDALGGHRERGKSRERLKGDFVGRLGNGREMVKDPERLEPERLCVLRQLDRPCPCDTSIPAVVLALPALKRHDANLHGTLLVRFAGTCAELATVGV